MNTCEYLDRVRLRLDLPSDYALQTPLNLSKSQLSRYRTGKDFLSDDVALRVSEILGIPAGTVLLDMHIERSRSPEVRAAWLSVVEKFSASFNLLLLGASPRQASFLTR
ncbi:hypothetical protein [Janthinobacterium sp. ZB1P44]|uniref:hypothetical protein n=1 Tax=Janthinobacterium sp. ZB1P44 TaxID=3424192 RepID=UPI003F2186FF